MDGISLGGIREIYLAHASEAAGALSGGVLDITAFSLTQIGMESGFFTEDGEPDEHGTSYTVSVGFYVVGEDAEVTAFERQYINSELHALCVMNAGSMRLFTGLTLSRGAGSGRKVADMPGRVYNLRGISSEEGAFVDSLI